MKLGFGTVRRREELEGSETLAVGAKRPPKPRPALPRAKLQSRALLDAELRRKEILLDAERRARELTERTERELAALRARVTDEAKRDAAAALTTEHLRFAAQEARADERGLERSIELARLLAERLLGEQLVLDPARVVSLARTALAEARGARKITLVANPEDAPALDTALRTGALEHVTRVLTSPEVTRGALRIESELGVLDAEIGPRLDRLVARLRERR